MFPAGMTDGVVTGGRVLSITGLGADLDAARDAAYQAMSHVRFDGMQVRRDIGWRAPGADLTSYAATGVDIAEGNRAVTRMRSAVERTRGAEVLRGVGSFGGVFSAKSIAAMDDPVLVASTDGVGTKVELAARMGQVRSVGHDIVNHCVGDVLVQGARPLFFLDYVASSALEADLVADVVTGMAEACEAAGCALLGGETAEMPGVYAPGAFDVAGTMVGVAERAALLPRSDVAAGDVLVGVASSGPHTNGYSLLRRVFEWAPMDVAPAGLDRPLGAALLEPHRNYLGVLGDVVASGQSRHCPTSREAVCWRTSHTCCRTASTPGSSSARGGSRRCSSWSRELRRDSTMHELHRTLNMGIGMVVIGATCDLEAVQGAIDEPTW